jgi:sulfur relay (sulfurtransferase) DsrC/TusE family protein
MYATPDNLRTLISHYTRMCQKRAQDPNTKLSEAYYEFILSFILDHQQQKELLPGLEKLFKHLIGDIYEEFENFRKLHLLIPSADAFLAMLRLPCEVYFHNLLESHIVQAWSQEMFLQFLDKRVHNDLYNSTESLILLKSYVQSLHPSFFNEQYSSTP